MNKPDCATFIIIAAPKIKNDFMVAMDLFEQGKVLGCILEMVVHYKTEDKLTLQQAGKHLEKIKSAYDQNHYIVSLVHLLQVERGRIIERNIGIIPPYFNAEVRIISTGKRWGMLDDFIRSLGWQVHTDEYRYIKGVS